MRRKTKIVLAITFMVLVMVSAFSYLYVSLLVRNWISRADESAKMFNLTAAYVAANGVPDLASTRVDTDNPKAVSAAIVVLLHEDPNLK